ncbi:hypothetical protein ACVWZL_000199 [Bradyrhizobium sp. GM2.4]
MEVSRRLQQPWVSSVAIFIAFCKRLGLVHRRFVGRC